MRPVLQAEGVTIEIPNTILCPSAKTKLAAGRIAKPFIITQPSEQSVHISLPTGSFTSYKLLTLANPPGLSSMSCLLLSLERFFQPNQYRIFRHHSRLLSSRFSHEPNP